MYYVTEKDLKANVRELRTEISTLSKEFLIEIRTLYSRVKELEDLVKLQGEIIQTITDEQRN